MPSSFTTSAARTNLSSNRVAIHDNSKIGEGEFRICYEGTYIGGNRNQQEAACKRFKAKYLHLETEFFANDFKIISKSIDLAEEWNKFCPYGKEIMINQGSIHCGDEGIKYLVEPYIRYYKKFTSNSGWVANDNDWKVRALTAFSHYTYHKTGGQMIVCDLQGRYRHDRYKKQRCRFELTDPAICSRRRNYGPTDLGEKGIHSFFANHCCNEFCDSSWQSVRDPQQWFPLTSGTSMLSSRMDSKLRLTDRTTFHMNQFNVIEEDEDEDEDDDGDYDNDHYGNVEFAFTGLAIAF